MKYLSFSPDGKLLASGHRGGVDLRETSHWRVVRRLEGGAWPVLFSPNGKHLAATSTGGICVWDTDTWNNVVLPTGLGALLEDVTVDAAGNLLVTGHASDATGAAHWIVRRLANLNP